MIKRAEVLTGIYDRQEGKLYWEALDIYYESTVMELDSLTFSQFRDDLNIENIRRIKGLIVTLRFVQCFYQSSVSI